MQPIDRHTFTWLIIRCEIPRHHHSKRMKKKSQTMNDKRFYLFFWARHLLLMLQLTSAAGNHVKWSNSKICCALTVSVDELSTEQIKTQLATGQLEIELNPTKYKTTQTASSLREIILQFQFFFAQWNVSTRRDEA